MDYERIQKPQGGGGFSPKKLRSMLLGVDKKRKEEEELESVFTSRSHVIELDETGGSGSDSCKDVDVVSVLPECSTSTAADSMAVQMTGEHRLKDQSSFNARNKTQEDPYSDCDSMSVASSIFDFHKAERGAQRVPLGPFSKPAPSKWDDAQKWIASPNANRPRTVQVQGGQAVGSRKVATFGYGSRQSSTKVVLEIPDQSLGSEEPDTKRIDSTQVCFSQHDSSMAIRSATTFVPPPSTARSVSMRDMGTEMTPIASQEPSRTGTPVRSTTPSRSPNSSRPSTPGKAARAPASSAVNAQFDHSELNNELSEKELQMKTRREIMALGTQLGKTSITAWASKEDEDKTVVAEESANGVIEARAAAWEEAEKAKYMARFKREEMKIQAWENHQKAKAEAEMKKIEVEVERMRARAHDKLMQKMAAIRHKAEEKCALAEAKRNQQAAKAEQQADYIRKTGRIPSSFSCWSWCS